MDIVMIVPGDLGFIFFQVLPELKRCLMPLLDAYLTCGVTTSVRSLSHPHLIVSYFNLRSFVRVLASCTSVLVHSSGGRRPSRIDFNALIVSERHQQGQCTSELSLPPPRFIAMDFCFLSRHAYMWVGMPIKM